MHRIAVSRKKAQVPTGVGTGFIFDKRGYIITNNHVVEGATSLTVATTDDKTYDGKIVGAYPDGDLAVVQIDCNGDCPTVPLGDSGKLQVGESVVAIGNALALEGGPTVTTGVVSALGRTQQEPSDTGSGQGGQGAQGAQGQYQQGAFLTDLIQTDAAINPGNSGGPLVNMKGEVVGINTAIKSNGGGYEGVGFAVPSSRACRVAADLAEFGRVRRAFVGISVVAADPETVDRLGQGATVVTRVLPESPASDAGLLPGDLLLKVGPTVVAAPGPLQAIIEVAPVGMPLTLSIERGGKRREIKVVPHSQPEGFGLPTPIEPPEVRKP